MVRLLDTVGPLIRHILSLGRQGQQVDMWIFGAKILGISSILGAINFVVTILKMKHPDLGLMKMSLFVWATLITSFMIITSMPTFAAAINHDVYG